ncbi:MAG TPA: chemotaxis response regulator protein-glutamate methylesterase [Bryobacteraceae bacterium]|jgi:two-component system chemotaxis response regulator CheB|nr:chemotaxis response regulator protein-glutamate methylesterase [Bryobacteraceae bacterium]
MMDARKIRVLVIDDSAIVRKILSETLASEADIEVVGTAPDPIIALEKIKRLKPDVLTLDIEMPRMDGLTFLKQIMQTQPMPVILISSLAQSSVDIALEALRYGAVDVLAKPSGPYSVGELRTTLSSRIRAAARAKLRRIAEPLRPIVQEKPASAAVDQTRLIAIGASTGGTEAIAEVLSHLPAGVPPILITQHIPPMFSRSFAQRLDKLCRMEVREAVDGDLPRPGLALVAPGGFHMVLERVAGNYRIKIKDGPLVCYQRPSVDVLFTSVAMAVGAKAVGAILTGMGNDGALGMKRMKDKGCYNIAQDEATCVVFGMPREAIRAGAVDQTLPLDRIAQALMTACS